MEVFLAFTDTDEYQLLEDTLDAWGRCDGAEVSAIRMKAGKKYELQRRIIADNLAKGKYYVVAVLGMVPRSDDIIRDINGTSKHQLNLLAPLGAVYVAEKGSVRKWVTPKDSDYNEQHIDSVKLSGGKVEHWADIAYKRLREC